MTIGKKILAALCVSGLMGLTACDTNRSTAERTESRTENREAASEQGRVTEEKVLGVQTEQMGNEEAKGESAEVQVQKEVTRSITSEEKVPTMIEGQKKFDINRMDAKDFAALGISRSLADRIVQYRESHNGFKSVDELRQVPGMSDSILRPLQGKLGAGNE